MIRFYEPVILLGILIIPFIIYFYLHYMKEKKKTAMKFSSLGLIKKSTKVSLRQHIPFILIIFSIILIIVGLADPHIPLKQAKEGVNVVLAIDASGSMSAQDYKPTRLEAAKHAASILINSLQPKDNIGIVIFESGATTASYLTPYKDKAIDKLEAISQKEGRTALGDGLSLAIDMATSIPNKKRVVILLSDGVSNAGVVSPQEAIQFAKVNKIQVYSVGMGSNEPVVLGYDFFGNPQYAELDETTLKAVASETGGKYFKAVDKNTLDEIYQNISKDIERDWEDTSVKDWFFAASLIVLLGTIYLIYGKYRIVV
jgi:Ca-activated chloride channel family protein